MRYHSSVPMMAIVIALLGTTAAVAAPRSLTPEDILRLTTLSDPRISPDGHFVAVIASRFGPDKKSNPDLYLVATDGSSPTLISGSPGAESSPRFSPDGSSLAFVALGDDDKVAQIYLYRRADRSIVQLGQSEAAVRELAWSPDGKSIAFLRSDLPIATEVERRKQGFDATVVDRDVVHTRLWLLDVASGKANVISPAGETVFHFSFSPDSRSVAVLASTIPTAEGHEYQSRLALVDVEKGTSRTLVPRANGLATPEFSPDGKWVAFIGQVGAFLERGILKVVSLSSGEVKDLGRDWPGNVFDVAWLPGENRLLVGFARGTHNYLTAVDLAGSKKELVEFDASMIPYWNRVYSIANDGRRVAMIAEGAGVGQEIVVADLQGAERRTVSNFNSYLMDFPLGKVSEWRWQNSIDGADVNGILIRPANVKEGDKTPLVVVLHGGPAYNWGIGAHVGNWGQLYAANGYSVLLPNFRGSSGAGMAWMTANVGDWGQGPTGDVLSGVDSLIAAGLVDRERLYVGGGSYGGYLTSFILGQSTRFKAAYVSAGVSNIATEYAVTDEPTFLIGYFGKTPYEAPEIYARNSPITYAKAVKTPVLIVHGERDARVPISQAWEWYMALKHYGVKTEFVIYPREYHGVREYNHQIDVMDRVLAWFSSHS